ncbi:MAG: DUF2309 domain-containing protein [Bacteroidia bacterium]|nr:DUF2309 domain-containing protein [Bacteroidia bacterium]
MNDIQDVQQAAPHKAAEFDQDHAIKELKHYLPAQASLKDFIHHNSLHAFQNLPFHEAAQTATELFGYKTRLTLKEYRQLYADKR